MTSALRGRGALITGASRGLGFAIAEGYVRAGADVFLCARNRPDLETARESLAGIAGRHQRVRALSADIADPRAIDLLVDAAASELETLCVLVSNAGIYGPKGPLGQVDPREWIEAVQINLVAPALLARAMIPTFRRAGHGKIVQLSGGGATSAMPGLSAYAASKAGVVRLAETLAAELHGDHVEVNALAPGALNTRMLDEILEAGAERVGEAFYERARAQQRDGGAPMGRAVELAVWLASTASDGVSGRLISAQWDDWDAPEFVARCAADPDFAMLRRIDGVQYASPPR